MKGTSGKGTKPASDAPPNLEGWILQVHGTLGLTDSSNSVGAVSDQADQPHGAEMTAAFSEVDTPETAPVDIPETPPSIAIPEPSEAKKLLLQYVESIEHMLTKFYTKAMMLWQTDYAEQLHPRMSKAKQLAARASVDTSLGNYAAAKDKVDEAKVLLDELEKIYQHAQHSQSKLMTAQLGDEKKLPQVLESIEKAGLQKKAKQLLQLEEEVCTTFKNAKRFCKDELGVQLSTQHELTQDALKEAFQALTQSDQEGTRQHISAARKAFKVLLEIYKQGFLPLQPQISEAEAYAWKLHTALFEASSNRLFYEVWGVSLKKFDEAHDAAQSQVLALQEAAKAYNIGKAAKARTELDICVVRLEKEQDNLKGKIAAQRDAFEQILAEQTSQFNTLMTQLQQLSNGDDLDGDDLLEFERTENTLSALSRLVWGDEGWRVSEMLPVLDASLQTLAALVSKLEAQNAQALQGQPASQGAGEVDKEAATTNALTKQFQKIKSETEQYYANWSSALEGEFETTFADHFDKSKEITARFSKSCVDRDLAAAQSAVDAATKTLSDMQKLTARAKASLATIEELADYYDRAIISLYTNRSDFSKWDLDLSEIDSACNLVDEQIDALRQLQTGPSSAEVRELTQQIEQLYKNACRAFDAVKEQVKAKKYRILAYYEEHQRELSKFSKLSKRANQLGDTAYFQFLGKSEEAKEAVTKLLTFSNSGDVFKLRSSIAQIDRLMDELRELVEDTDSDVEETGYSSSEGYESD